MSKFPRKALIPYITYGDPHSMLTEKLIQTSLDHGADVIELGIPFSDPIADGPVIQASHQRALQNDPDLSLRTALKMVKKFKQTTTTPFILMIAVNLVYQVGIEMFFDLCKTHAVDGVVIPDLSVEEASPYVKMGQKTGVHVILLASPLCTQERLEKIVKLTSGFLYLISSTGTTGARATLSNQLPTLVKKCKKIKDIPIYIGFGIHTHAHVQDVLSYADGAIVGSHLVKIVEHHLSNLDSALESVGLAISTLKGK